MTNALAFLFVVLIGGFFALDHYVLHWNAPVEALRITVRTIDYLAFWR